MVPAIHAYLDEQEAYSWEAIKAEEQLGEELASQRYPPRSVVKIVEDLMALSENDVGFVMETFSEWSDLRGQEFTNAGQTDRADHVGAMNFAILLQGIGNLFGFVPEGPAFDSELAAAGRERGWRS